ncbi:MAG: hypothetical protein LBQ56_03590 [Synergistaceae bacterium]|jgi:hypothetical protein|nr:hypothetical protein [Synergistaceae bacterium]
MKVLFDLRPAHLVQNQDQRVDPIRLLSALLFVIFCLLSIFNIAYTTMKLFDVRAELMSAKGDEIAVSENVTMLTASINTMREIRDRARIYLEFTRQELPVVEFMAALEGAITSGITITTMEIRPGNVMMKGSAVGDQDIIDFSSRLDGMKNIVTKVDAPVTTRGALGNRPIADYTVTCNIRSISDIAASMPDMPIPGAVEGSVVTEGAGE